MNGTPLMMSESVNPMLKALEERASQPFSPIGDDVFVGILLLLALLLAAVLADGTCYLRQLVAGYSIGHSRRLSDEVRTSRALYMRLLLLLLATVSSSFCLVNLLHASGALPGRTEALTLLLGGMAGVTLLMLLKTALYSLVGAILFTPQQTAAWNQVYTDTFIFTGIVSYLFAIAGAFFPLPPRAHVIIALTIAMLAETWLAVKAFHIFFVKKYGGLHLIVYLCTLEWIPLLVLGKFFIQSSL